MSMNNTNQHHDATVHNEDISKTKPSERKSLRNKDEAKQDIHNDIEPVEIIILGSTEHMEGQEVSKSESPDTIYSKLLEVDSNDELSEESVKRFSNMKQDSEDKSLRKEVEVRRLSTSKRKLSTSDVKEKVDIEGVEDEDEYILVEEEVDEEIEVETSEEEAEDVEEEYIEEESKEEEELITFEEINTKLYEEADEEIQEELDDEMSTIEETVLEQQLVEDLEAKAIEEFITEEEAQKVHEEIMYEGEEGSEEEEMEEVGMEKVGMEEDRMKEEEIEEEEIEEGEIEEGEIEEGEIEEGEMEEKEKEALPTKKRKFKTIKIIRLVRKRKVDVLKDLQKYTLPQDVAAELQQQAKEKEQRMREEKEEIKEHEKTTELIRTLVNEIILLKKKQHNLTKPIIEYHKWKFENVQEVEPPTTDNLVKYYKRLKFLGDFKKAYKSELERISNETLGLKNELIAISEDYKKEKLEVLNWEREVGKETIIGHTGKPLEETVVTHLVQHHEVLLDQLSKERLKFLSLQSRCLEKEDAIRALSWFEGGLSLLDYEQLHMDNHMFCEKLEERENELINLRKIILGIIHTQAHVLEKTDCIADTIKSYNTTDSSITSELNRLRESVGVLKKSRDRIRDNTNKLKKNAGLLTRPKLAKDYEISVTKIVEGRSKLSGLINTFKKQQLIIQKMRKEISLIISFNDL